MSLMFAVKFFASVIVQWTRWKFNVFVVVVVVIDHIGFCIFN